MLFYGGQSPHINTKGYIVSTAILFQRLYYSNGCLICWKVLEIIIAKNSQGMTALSYATRGANMEIVKMVSTSMAKYLSPSQVGAYFGNPLISLSTRGAQ